MNVIRPAHAADRDGLLRLAHHLNTVNLPADPDLLATMLIASDAQFEGSEDADQAMIFVLESSAGTLLGSATIIPLHGSPQAPHCYLDVIEEERYSARLQRVFHHRVLRLGTSFHPRTEIGGLVLDPDLRGQGIGRFISLARFQFIAAYRHRFCDHVLAELLPPFDREGNSPLWNALGQRFTGLTYREADRLSGQDKEFIEDLFPRTDIYVSLFSEATQKVIGSIGPDTEPALRLLLDEGFFNTNRIDPFDGGPHYRAVTDEIRSVRETRRAKAVIGSGTVPAIVATLGATPSAYRAVHTHVGLSGLRAEVDESCLTRLGAEPGDDLLVTPL